MAINTLQEIREKLDNLIDKGADSEEILRVSVELDRYIELYMEKQKKI